MSPDERLDGPRAEPDPAFLAAAVEALPGGVFVLDGVGGIRFCTAAGAALLGLTPAEVVGRSVLDFVSADTAWAYAAAVALATDYPDVLMGPMRVGFHDARGELRDADLWATNRLDDPTIEGIVCLVTEQTTSSGLAEAVAAVAEDAPVAEVVARVERAMAGHPVVADASLVVDGMPGVSAALSEVVRHSAEVGLRSLFPDVEQLAAVGLAEEAAARGAGALWIEPVLAPEGSTPAALVLWRRRPGNPSPNQLRSVFQAAAILDLARRAASDRAGEHR